MQALERATDEFVRAVAAVAPDAWSAPSPCEGWDARTVANHVVGGNIFAVRLLNGATTEEAVQGYADDHLGADPERAAADTSKAQLEAFQREGALDGIVHHVIGDIPAQLFLSFRTADLAVHAWDIARATGGDETMDPDLAAELWRQVQPLAPNLAASGRFGEGPSGSLPADAPAQLRLLDAYGRRP